MTVRALVGLALFNLFLLGVGTATLGALRGWRAWHDFVRIGGLAYLLGVALMGVTLSIGLVLGIPFSFATIVLTGAALALAAVALRALFPDGVPSYPTRVRRGSRWSASRARRSSSSTWKRCSDRPVSPRSPPGTPGRSGSRRRRRSTSSEASTSSSSASSRTRATRRSCRRSRPPRSTSWAPPMSSRSTCSSGSSRVGFAAAVAGLLAPRVSPYVLWPCIILVLVTPRVVGRNLDPQADFLLDYFFALAALLVALWLVERGPGCSPRRRSSWPVLS